MAERTSDVLAKRLFTGGVPAEKEGVCKPGWMT